VVKERWQTPLRAAHIFPPWLRGLRNPFATRTVWLSEAAIRDGQRHNALSVRSTPKDDNAHSSVLGAIVGVITRLSRPTNHHGEGQAQGQGGAAPWSRVVATRDRSADAAGRAFFDTATREIVDPLTQLVELLKLHESDAIALVDPALLLHSAEEIKLSVLAMLGTLEEWQPSPITTEVDLYAYFDQLLDRYGPRFRRKGLALHVRGCTPRPLNPLCVDTDTLDTVLEKLLDNALAFTPEGEVRVRWQVEEGGAVSPALVVAVKDTGVGIAKPHQKRVFDRYTHCCPEERAVPRSGLGLYIVRQLLTSKGGRVDLVSQQGIGSKFSVRLPVSPGKRSIADHAPRRGPTVLTVGLSESHQQLIEVGTADQGLKVLQSDTAIEALAVLKQESISLLWVDDDIEDMDLDSFLAEAMKRQEQFDVVLWTSNEAISHAGGMQLQKNSSKSDIEAIIRELREPAYDRTKLRLETRLRLVSTAESTCNE